MIVVLPLDTIVRILDHANRPRRTGSKISSGRTASPPTGKAAPGLANNIIDVLNTARKDKANVVGPLDATQFNDLSSWCRSVGLTKEGETVEAAVRASG